MEALEGKNVAVLGLGISGRSAARFCAERGAVVTAIDERDAGQIDGLVELGALAGIELAVGAPFPDLAEFDLERFGERAADRAWIRRESEGFYGEYYSIRPES